MEHHIVNGRATGSIEERMGIACLRGWGLRSGAKGTLNPNGFGDGKSEALNVFKTTVTPNTDKSCWFRQLPQLSWFRSTPPPRKTDAGFGDQPKKGSQPWNGHNL